MPPPPALGVVLPVTRLLLRISTLLGLEGGVSM